MCMTALLIGTLRLEEGCLYVEPLEVEVTWCPSGNPGIPCVSKEIRCG